MKSPGHPDGDHGEWGCGSRCSFSASIAGASLPSSPRQSVDRDHSSDRVENEIKPRAQRSEGSQNFFLVKKEKGGSGSRNAGQLSHGRAAECKTDSAKTRHDV